MSPVPNDNSLSKPRLRGQIHYASAFAALGAGLMLVIFTSGARATLATAIYAASLVNLLATSASYHIPTWSPRARARMRKLDHAAIFILIAGTFTPICLLAMTPEAGTALLTLVWTGAALGTLKEFLWPKAPKFITALICVILGWTSIPAVPRIYQDYGIITVVLMLGGGVAFTLGALAYALKRPNPRPALFGYHEVFHALVVLAAAMHFAMITIIAT
ncbi:hemolysin III [Lujinxingia litoralis]|uniref:Hemolysin III n=1 Tax=Lujinxingia litoralis TaxID=2211119 RepID=A0A328C3P3_9DELT|nr:hemolysin III family protein [Lujinxingia litoralis]RAL20441.1 hemolysin III [Lujinxingia litoralis]